MNPTTHQNVILGIDPTPRGLAFVAVENGGLLDWGTRRKDGEEIALLERLIERYGTKTIVLEDAAARGSERRPRMRALLAELAFYARSRGLTVMTVTRAEVRSAWRRRGFTRKYTVAAYLATLFPELGPLVPPRRKVYQSETARAEIFDALTLVLHASGMDAGELQQ